MLKPKIIFLAFLFFQLLGQGFGFESNNSKSSSLLDESLTTEGVVDTILIQLEKKIEIASKKRDTLQLIQLHKSYAFANGSKGNYYLVFNALWKALLLADQKDIEVEQFIINMDIGRFYGYLKRYEKAKEHYKIAATIKNQLSLTNKFTDKLAHKFYSIQENMHRRMGNIELSKAYLDSCYMQIKEFDSSGNFYFLELERGLLLAENKKYEEALSLLQKALPKIKLINPAFSGIGYTHLGDIYRQLHQYDKSQEAYQESIRIIESHRGHLDFLPLAYEQLANLNFELGKHKEAFLLHKKMQHLNFEYFDSRSNRNKYLMNVQDDFRLYKEKEQKRFSQQELIQLQQQQKLLLFQRILLVGCVAFLGLLGLIYFKLQKGKIAAEKALNHQLQLQNKEKQIFLNQIENKNEELITFSNIMSHDLKAPLRTISAFTGLVEKQVQGNFQKEKVLSYTNFITNSAESMRSLIEDLLLYSRVNLEKSEFSDVSLNDLTLLVLPAFSYDINLSKAVVNVAELPTIKGNKGLLKTVFHNLISNAIKYQPKDKSNHQAKVDIWAMETENQHCIFIQDNGIGIKSSYVEKLFQPFVRFHASSEYKGTGLGMSICQRIMDKHQGQIQLDFTSPSGSRFKLIFPKYDKLTPTPTIVKQQLAEQLTE